MLKNPLTTITGYVIIGLTWLQQVFVEQSIPQNGKEWIQFIIQNVMGLVALFAKDFNRTNSPVPAIETHPIDTVASQSVGLPTMK